MEAVRNASSWRELGEMLGVTTESGMRSFIRGHAARIGLDLSHLSSPAQKPHGRPPALSAASYEPEHLRRAAPALAMAWFVLRGFTPLLPIEPEPYDLAVNTPEGMQRVQVKSTTCKSKGDGHWHVKVGHGAGGLRDQDVLLPYDHEAIELFFIVDGDINMYLIPSLTLAGRVRIAIDTYEKFCVGNGSGLLGAVITDSSD